MRKKRNGYVDIISKTKSDSTENTKSATGFAKSARGCAARNE